MKNTQNKIVTYFLLIVYILAVVKIILFKYQSFPIQFIWNQLISQQYSIELFTSRLAIRGNVVPFHTIFSTLTNINYWNAFNLIGNIAIFIPLGILLSHLNLRKVYITLWCFLFTSTLESLQLILSMGTFDIDDMILNVFGGMIGLLLYRIVRLRVLRYAKKSDFQK